MIVLKWICFILVCLDTVSYIIEQADRMNSEHKPSTKVGRLVGLCLGIAARVYVLYGAAAYWLLA